MSRNALIEPIPAMPGPAYPGYNPYAHHGNNALPPNYNAFETQEPGSSARGLANTLLQHASLIAGSFLVLLALAILYLLFATPVYRIDTLVQIDERNPLPIVSTQQGNGQVPQPAATPLAGEIEILRSRDLLMHAVDQTNADIDITVNNRMPFIGPLYARWHEAQQPGVAEAPFGLGHFAWGGERVEIQLFDIPNGWYEEEFTLRATDGQGGWEIFNRHNDRIARGRAGEMASFALYDQPAKLLIAKLQAAEGTQFTLVKHSPANMYEALQSNLTVGEAARQSGVIRVTYDHQNRERALNFIQALTTGYIERTMRRRTADAEQSLKFLERELPQLKSRLDASEQALSGFRSKTATLNVDQETQSSLLRSAQLERDRVELQMRARQLSQRYLPQHPELQAVNQQLRVVESALGQLNQSAGQLPANQRDYVRLQREVQTNAALYTALLTSAQELQLTRASMTPTARVVDPPSATDKPVRPKPLVVLSMAAGIGLLIGVMLAFIRRQLHPTVQDAEDIEMATGLMTLAYIPESHGQRKLTRWSVVPHALRGGKPPLLALHAPSEPAIESLRSFRSGLLPSERQVEKTVLIAAPTAGMGKTFIAANLATLLAAANRRVLLIDADLRRPRLHRYFRSQPNPGLAEVLNGEMDINDAIRTEAMANLDLLLAGRARRNPADLLLSPNLRKLLDQLEERYDCIVIDSAPVLPVADSLAFAQFGLQTFLVARSEASTVREVREAARRLDSVGGRVQGVLFNGVKRARFGSLNYHYAYPQT